MDIDGKSEPVNSFASQKGMVQLKSAATSLLYKFGTIDIYGYLGSLRISLGFLRAL